MRKILVSAGEASGDLYASLVVRVGQQKRTIILPAALAAYRPQAARFEGGALQVVFERGDDGTPES